MGICPLSHPHNMYNDQRESSGIRWFLKIAGSILQHTPHFQFWRCSKDILVLDAGSHVIVVAATEITIAVRHFWFEALEDL